MQKGGRKQGGSGTEGGWRGKRGTDEIKEGCSHRDENGNIRREIDGEERDDAHPLSCC